MKCTIEIDERLYHAAMKQAEDGDRSFSDMVDVALRVYLRDSLPFELWWITRSGKPAPGIDFTSRDSLYGFPNNSPNSD